jgi:riboflavin kinase/FMN adenylyltransferase
MMGSMAVHYLYWDEVPPVPCQRGALAIGNFDGVHRGHLSLLAELRRRAEAVGGPAVALTFDPHPLQLLRPEQFQPVLTNMSDRAGLLQRHGADHVLILRSTLAMLHLGAEEFFDQVVCRQLAARALVEGVNFGFGRNREGDVATLRALCTRAGIDLAIVPPLTTPDGVTISSSRVRTALVRGDVHDATALLGRPYRLRGTVGTGQRRGQQLGFPTANLEQMEMLVPGDGVYAVRVLAGDKVWPGAANIGPNPTFGEQARKVEVHLIGFEGELYGQRLAVDFIARLRETRPFGSVAQLVAQLHADIDQARQIVGQLP